MSSWILRPLTLGALLALGVLAPAQAEEGAMAKIVGSPTGDLSPSAVFGKIDSNGDGKVDRTELRTHKMDVFFLRDKDQDTHLSPQEFDALSDALFAALDGDKDGRISGFEFNQSEVTKFESIDADGDSAITLEEFQTFRVKIAE